MNNQSINYNGTEVEFNYEPAYDIFLPQYTIIVNGKWEYDLIFDSAQEDKFARLTTSDLTNNEHIKTYEYVDTLTIDIMVDIFKIITNK